MFKTIPVRIIAAILAVAAAVVLVTQPAHAQEKTKTERLLGESLNEFASDENGWSHLHWAALANDAEAVRKLLEAGAVHSPRALGDRSPFSAKGKVKAELLGRDMGRWTNRKQTPIMVADAFENAAIVSILAKHGAFLLRMLRGTPPPKTENFDAGELDINYRDEDNESHLHRAAGKNDLTAAQWLIANGAEVNAKDEDDWTPLHVAADENATETAALLLENGAEVNAKDNHGGTPLHGAALNNETETTALLLENGAEVNAKDNYYGDTPLHGAALNNLTETAALLLENGAAVNAKNNDGWTPSDRAMTRVIHYEMKSLLKRHGGRCNKRCLH